MKNNETTINRIFSWANEQVSAAVAQRDFGTFKKAIVLAAVCANGTDEAAVIRDQLTAIELSNFLSLSETGNIHADLPFFVVCHKLLGYLPLDLYARLSKIQADIKKEIESGHGFRSLAAFLLISQINRLKLNATPSPDICSHLTHPVPFYLHAGDNELNSLVYAIHIYSGFGTQQLLSEKMLESILEVRMLEASRNYNLVLAGYILTALQYMGAGHNMASADAIKFLINNQSEEGFIGYYGREFQAMKITSDKDRIDFQLSSTLVSAIAILEHNTGYRFYQNIFRQEVEFAQPEFI